MAQTKLLYAGANRMTAMRLAVLDLPEGNAMRAPGEAPGLMALEIAMDEMAEKLGIARSLLKHPDIMVINEATSILDAQAQARIMDGIWRECEGRTLIWALHDESLADRFDRCFIVSDGRLSESARHGELAAQ